MQSNTMQMRVNERPRPGFGGAEAHANHDNGETPYWGILCRTCRELVAFDLSPFASFGPGAASMKPGAVRCGNGHNHIYFPRDFHFSSSPVPISDATMYENREAYRAINFLSHPLRDSSQGELLDPKAAGESESRSEAQPSRLLSDARKEAGAAAKERWRNWALKKAT